MQMVKQQEFVHKFQPDNTHKLAGSFKILADGIMTRFTGLSKIDWNNYMNSAEAEYKKSLTPAVDESKIETKVA